MRRFLQSFRYAFAGIGHVLRTQRNARVHATVAALVVIAAALFRLSPVEWAVLILTIGSGKNETKEMGAAH